MTEQKLSSYEEITEVAGRTYLRKNFTPGRQVYKVPFDQIQVREGFNHRKVYSGIEELAHSLDTHGQLEPFCLDVLPDGRYFIFRGHRRHRAYQLLIKQGKFDPGTLVEFFPTPAETRINGKVIKLTEFDRLIDQYVSNNMQSPYTPLENAAIANDAKFNFGSVKTNKKVAQAMGVSRQTVDNWIMLTTQPAAVKKEIAGMSYTAAINYIREQHVTSKNLQYPAEEFKAVNLVDFPKVLQLDSKQADEQEEKSHRTSMGKSGTQDNLKKEIDDLYELMHPNGEENTAIKKYKSKSITDSPTGIAYAGTAKENGIVYDESRQEIRKVQNVIKLTDRIGVRVDQLDIPDGDKKDIYDWIQWIMADLDELRAWVHQNKKR